jgi:hypothetical protein
MNETSAAPRGGDAPFVIVAALDHSDRDRFVLSAALGLALGAAGSGLHLAHVVEPGPPGPLPIGTASRVPTTLSVIENAEHFLAARALQDVRGGTALWCGEHAPEHPMSRAYGLSAGTPG